MALTRESVQLRIDALRAVWVLVASRQNDSLAAQIADLGKRLTRARDAEDWGTARVIILEARTWMATFAGVVTSRMTAFWERT